MEEKKSQEDWMTRKWRPMMAIMYMLVCLCDFAIFPILWTLVQFYETEAANDAFRQWAPITLQGGGLFHVAMGAVLGVSAWSRGQEKIAGATSPSLPDPVPAAPSVTNSLAQGSPGTSAQDFAPPAPKAGFGGKLAPPAAPQPLI